MATHSLPSRNHNLEPLGEVADELGLLQSDIKRLQEREKALKEQLAAQGEITVSGAFFAVSVKTSQRSNIDTGLLRKMLAPELIASISKTTNVTSVVCKALPFVPAIAAE